MSDSTVPVQAVRSQVASAINIMIQLSRISDGSRKVTHISEGIGMDLQGNYITNDIYLFEQTGRTPEGKIIGHLGPAGNLPTFIREIEVNHLPFPRTMFEKKPGAPAKEVQGSNSGGH